MLGFAWVTWDSGKNLLTRKVSLPCLSITFRLPARLVTKIRFPEMFTPEISLGREGKQWTNWTFLMVNTFHAGECKGIAACHQSWKGKKIHTVALKAGGNLILIAAPSAVSEQTKPFINGNKSELDLDLFHIRTLESHDPLTMNSLKQYCSS